MQGRCPDVDVLIQRRAIPGVLREPAEPEDRRRHIASWIEDIWREKDRRLQSVHGKAATLCQEPTG